MNDQAFIDAFTAGQLDPGGFDHRAHLRAAFLLLGNAPFLQAVAHRHAGACRQAGQAGPLP